MYKWNHTLRDPFRILITCGCAGFSLLHGLPLVAVHGLLTGWFFLLQSTGSRVSSLQQLWRTGLAAPQHAEFPDQGSNPHPLHCQADSSPLDHLCDFFGLFVLAKYFLSLTHIVVACISTFYGWIFPIVWLCHNLLIHSSPDGLFKLPPLFSYC